MFERVRAVSRVRKDPSRKTTWWVVRNIPRQRAGPHISHGSKRVLIFDNPPYVFLSSTWVRHAFGDFSTCVMKSMRSTMYNGYKQTLAKDRPDLPNPWCFSLQYFAPLWDAFFSPEPWTLEHLKILEVIPPKRPDFRSWEASR